MQHALGKLMRSTIARSRGYMHALFGSEVTGGTIEERHKSVRFFSMVFAPGALLFACIDLYLGHLLVSSILLLFSLLLAALLLWVPEEKVDVHEAVVMLLATLLATTLIYAGGILNAGIYWVMLYPFIAFFICGQRQGWYWVALMLLLVILLMVLQASHQVVLAYENPHLLYFMGVFLFYTLLAAGLNLLRRRYERVLEGRIDAQSRTARGYLERLEYLALYDALTDLPNRNLAKDRIAQAIEDAKRDSASFAVALLDIEHFSGINTLLGEQRADAVLTLVAARLKQCVRGNDTVARMDGDEFLVLWSGVDETTVTHVVGKLQQAMEPPLEFEDTSLAVAIRLGVVLYPQHGDSVTPLLQHVRTVHRRAKSQRLDYLLYQSEWFSEALRRAQLLARMRDAIGDEQMALVFQPQVTIGSGKVFGVEALLRWPDPDEGVIQPGEFIPLAERSRLIEELTLMTLELAARQDHQWRDQGVELHMSVNLSARNLIDRDLPKKVARCLSYYDGQANNFTLEITETDIMAHPDLAQSVMLELAAMGVQLSIDDFGTGYSSLAYLRKLPVNELKIDQSFVRDYMHNQSDQMIVASMYSLAHALDLKVVTEGVEDADTWDALHEIGVDIAQGYLISRPLEPEALICWLKSLDQSLFDPYCQ